MTKTERAVVANRFIEAIASCGRMFFAHKERVSRFEVDARGRVWFIDGYTGRRIYTHYKYHWRGFTEGGTLRALVENLRDFIRTGETPKLNFGPWPRWLSDGDMWGYGEDMEKVRSAAIESGLRRTAQSESESHE